VLYYEKALFEINPITPKKVIVGDKTTSNAPP
jgi:hypothetical protein